MLTSDLQRKAMTKLVGLQFPFQYKKGCDNTVADALSRVGHLLVVSSTSQSQSIWLQEVTNSYTVDPEAQTMLQKLAVHAESIEGFTLQ